MNLHLSRHAVARARQRAGVVPDLRHAVPLPKSAARRLASRCERGTRHYATATTVLVVQAGRVVTCLALPLPALAEELVRLMFDHPGRVPA